MIFVTLMLLMIIIFLSHLYFTWNFNYWEKRGVKGPKPKIFFGTQINAITHKRSIVYDFFDHYNKFKATEKFIGIFATRSPELLILAPDVFKEIYVSKFHSFHDNYFSQIFDVKSEPLFASNPLALIGQEWKQKRAELIPALTTNRLKAYYPIMMKICSKMVDFIRNKNKIEGEDYVFNCRKLTQRFTIQNVADFIYGIDAGAFEINSSSEILQQGMDLITNLFTNFNTVFILGSIPLLGKLWRKRLTEKEGETFLAALTKNAIELRESLNETERIDFLNYLIQLKQRKGLIINELQGHANTVFFDGFETSGVALAHVLLCIGRNKNIQNKLRHEIEMNSFEDEMITFEKLLELPYLDQCVKEALRLFPPAIFSQKVCTQDTELINSDGNVVKIKRGIPVTIPIYCIHNDERFYTNPMEYNPERFNPENGGEKKFKDLGVFLPFGDGPRACLGQKFGLAQIKTCLYELVKNFEISISSKTRNDNLLNPENMQLFLDGGIWLIFKELNN